MTDLYDLLLCQAMSVFSDFLSVTLDKNLVKIYYSCSWQRGTIKHRSNDQCVCSEVDLKFINFSPLTPADRFLRQVVSAEEWSITLIGVFGAYKNRKKEAKHEGDSCWVLFGSSSLCLCVCKRNGGQFNSLKKKKKEI